MPNPGAARARRLENPESPARVLPVVGRARELGFPLRLTDDGGVQRLIQQRSLRFTFRAAGVVFEAGGEAAPAGVAISIRARLGRLPAAGSSEAARREVMALMATPPAGAAAALIGDDEVVLDGGCMLRERVTPVSLIAALAGWVIDAQPWLAAIAVPLAGGPAA